MTRYENPTFGMSPLEYLHGHFWITAPLFWLSALLSTGRLLHFQLMHSNNWNATWGFTCSDTLTPSNVSQRCQQAGKLRGVGLSQMCSKIFPKCFQEFPQNFTYYACIILLICQQFIALCMENLSNDCSIRVFHYKVTVLLESIDLRSYVQCFFCSSDISLTALLKSIDLSVFWNIYLLC